ncbi:hypothetical protein [Caulobacter sp. RL271]|jgi:hypothetical protein|uniref:Secreted protein n=1 Tax=Caulobacter segnis TaxID=88688 RepID=A0ABY5A0K2_9CAUL|nr:hypothetical protein [Caulobacter segnis]USQ98124.1 hypothetical protein MZV50_11510 [Caulobacter segnis]
MKTLIIATVAVASLAGVAHAGPTTNLQFLEAARCRGLAGSENLGKLDTASLDSFLRAEAGSRDIAVRTSAQKKIASAQKEADGADADKKTKLLAEREAKCGVYMGSGK